MASKTDMLIFAVIEFLIILGSEAALYQFENTKVAAERENIHSTEYNMELHPRVQQRSAIENPKSSYGTQNWACPIDESSDFPNIWYRYLNRLYCEFSRYEIQVAKQRYNVADIKDFGLVKTPNPEKNSMQAQESNEDQGIKITEDNFEIFLDKTKVYNIAEQDSIREMKITRKQLGELNHILDLTIKDKLIITCTDQSMFIKGNFIVYSHVNISILTGTVDESCRELFITGMLKYLNIFALNTIFIDEDMIKMADLITVISPKWEIIGRRRIELDGENGESQDTTAPARPDLKKELPAMKGNPGKPGEPGGNFFGIGEMFSGGENLIISVNGGNGSAGQDGENGVNGTDGEPAEKIPESDECSEPCSSGRYEGFKCEKKGCHEYSKVIFGSTITDYKCSFYIFGNEGVSGENGGNGGKGGEGGYPGYIAIIELNGHSGVTQMKNRGSNGLDGKGGIAGKGGKKGDDATAKCVKTDGPYLPSWNKYIHRSYERAASGKDGIDGGNTENMQMAIEATDVSKLDKAKTVNQYKSFLRANMNDPFRNVSLVNFLNRLEKTQDVKSIYDTSGFLDELRVLEEQFHNLNEHMNFLPFYESLLDRISEYALQVQNSNDKKVLVYLYTVTLGRKHNLEDDLESNLVIDITTYLKSVKDHIEKLNDLQNVKARVDIVNNYTTNYKTEIDKKIKDANDLIAKEILPEIDSVKTEIDDKIQKLINEVIKFQNETKKEIEDLKDKENKLEKAILLQGILGPLKILGQALSFLGPTGAVAGSVMGFASSSVENALLDTPVNSESIAQNMKQSETRIKSLENQINKLNEYKASELKKKLDSLSQELDKSPNELAEISEKISDLKSKLDTSDKKTLTIKKMQDFENELKKTLETQKEILTKVQGGANNATIENAIAVIDKLQKLSQISSVTLETLNKYEKSEKELAGIRKAIQMSEKKLDQLKKYEENIYTIMVPMLENIENDLDNMISKIDNKDRVALDVTKWKVKSTLKDLMFQMEQITKGFEMQDNLKHCIGKLMDAMFAVINVQDHIQDYQKDQALANFIAGVSSANVNNNDVFYGPELEAESKDLLQDLKITISTNIVIQRYRVAMDAFKQFVFPLAHQYLKGTLLPSQLELDKTDIGNVVHRAATQIEEIRSKLEAYKAIVNKHDDCFFTGYFNVTSDRPFFTWTNKKHKKKLSKLLSGTEVILKANIAESPTSKFAIKFQYIEFDFKSNISNVTSELKEALKGFNIRVTHFGDSYYRYKRKFYLITSGDVTFEYSFKKKDPEQSLSYKKIITGDYMLSPYATWKIKLYKDEGSSFKDLAKFKRNKCDVDLVLGGTGNYAKKREGCGDFMVNQYYNAVHPNV